MGVTLKSVGSAFPKRIVKNEELTEHVETSDQWIRERSGIEQRYVATDESNLDTAMKAAYEALENNGDPIDKDDIDLLIFCTVTPDQIVPSMSSMLKMEMGLTNAIGFDVNAACSAFVYAMWMAEALIQTGKGKTALIVCSERLSRVMNWKDRGTCILFGDGAGAAIIQKDDSKPGILGSYIKNYDDTERSLGIGMDYYDIPFHKDEKSDMTIYMNGNQVFKFAVTSMTDAIEQVLNQTGTDPDEIKYYVPHQANLRIIKAAAKRFNQPLDKFQISVQKHANVSAATIPIALNELIKDKDKALNPGDKIMIAGFGGGLSAAAMLIEI